jgi:hypothetical protein
MNFSGMFRKFKIKLLFKRKKYSKVNYIKGWIKWEREEHLRKDSKKYTQYAPFIIISLHPYFDKHSSLI